MTTGRLISVLLAVAIATATGIHQGSAQTRPPNNPPPNNPPPPTNNPPPFIPSSHRDNGGWYALGGVLAPIIGLTIKIQFFPENGPGSTGPQRTFPPRQPFNAQLPGNLPFLPGTGGAGGAGGAGGGTGAGALRGGFYLPRAGETAFVTDQVILTANVPTERLNVIAARHNMTLRETITLPLINRTLHLGHIDSGVSVAAMITGLASEGQIAGAQPNFVYRGAQTDQVPINTDQYAPQKLNLAEAHRLARGNRILIAVIDSQVDASHPDLAGAITANFEASADGEKPHPHGTAMAGAIAARRNMLGIAPGVGLLTVRAFSARADSVEGTTFNIIKEPSFPLYLKSFPVPSDRHISL